MTITIPAWRRPSLTSDVHESPSSWNRMLCAGDAAREVLKRIDEQEEPR
jgi:hypothetical protein